MLGFILPLWAIHISDGYINVDLRHPLVGLPWIIGGFVGMALSAFWGSRRIRDEEIPRIALLTAAFTVASGLHVKLGPSSVHLILNGLLGAVLGRRAALAIPIGLFLQAVAGHGGFTTLGINSCIMTVPALLAAAMVRGLRHPAWLDRGWFRSLLIGSSTFVWALSLAFGIGLVVNRFTDIESLYPTISWFVRYLPFVLPGSALLALLAILAERRIDGPREFALGFLVGEATVLLSVALCALVMYFAGPANEGAELYALLVFLAHLPIATVEGVVVGFMLAYLVRVKPEMIYTEWGNGTVSVFSPQVQERGAEQCPVDAAP
jgi:cobalt/nickel transport system permease protein